MEFNEIVAELKKKLGDSPLENEKILKAEGDKFVQEGNLEGVKAVGQLLLENMPEEERNEIYRLTHIDGMRLDEMHQKIVDMINKKQFVDALPLAERLYKKIILEYADNDKEKFVCLRNPFEDNLCQVLFKTDKILKRTPFDVAAYLTTYAFLLVETGANIDAIPILERAIEYNPVDVSPKFELTEVYKITFNKKKVLEMTRDTLAIASSPSAVARCYANVGYALTNSGDYEDAAIFYTASAMFEANPAIPREMQHLADLKGSPITVSSRNQIYTAMQKYDINFGFSTKVIETAAQLASHYLGMNDIPNALNALKILYVMTLDEDVKNLILKYDPKSPQNNPPEENA